jgi:molybdopterin synthase sulfur carrier subunit
MTIHLDLPEELAAVDRVALSGARNVRAAIEALEESAPGLKARICDAGGNVRRTLRIFANGADIRFLDNLETPLCDGARLRIQPSTLMGS